MLMPVRQDHEKLMLNRSAINTPLRIGSRSFEHGLGSHSTSMIRITSPTPLRRFTAWIGVDKNERTQSGTGSVTFAVTVGGHELYRSRILRGGQEPERLDLDLQGTRVVELHVSDGGDGPACDHADWAEAAISTAQGLFRLDALPQGGGLMASRLPFSFTYGGKSSDELLAGWKPDRAASAEDGHAGKRTVDRWTDPATGLQVTCESVRYTDFPAVEWMLYFENTGEKDTPILADIQAINLAFHAPLSGNPTYRLHHTKGAPSNPTDFEPAVLPVDGKHARTLGAGGGRSSNRDFPFFRIDTGEAAVIVAVGWSGQWQAKLVSDDKSLHLTAGMEKTHFLLHPGEKVRSPRILILYWDGHADESLAQFRQLVYKHYAAKLAGQVPEPILFCNTCFTRGGGWLNECNAANQISLIHAYAPLGLQALLTDAGWFEGGWPAGAGNWNPRKDAYPDGMAPVAAAAKDKDMIYGLWFEPERVVGGTTLHREHPDWVLGRGNPNEGTFLADFGRPEVQEYFFNIVKGFMALPGFRFYRQDFNMDPLPYWRHNDAPDRQGITEIKYIQGLYAYWDRIAATWPDSMREECASGGRRIDLETVMRMHLHQKTDYWFDNEVDQASLWALSQYLPNNVFVAHLNRMDDYSFHSTLASSLCMGWIADAADFDLARGKKLLDRYREVRPLLTGAWYPLLPYSRAKDGWIASQYHRADLGAGMILAFRREQSPFRTAELKLRGLESTAAYELTYDIAGRKLRATGADLMNRFELTLPERHRSELISYRRVD
jgi:alpha-galactosidase